MDYKEYYSKFNKNDREEVVQLVPNSEAVEFLYENAPRLYCPDQVIEETFAFRTWTMRKHLMETEDGILLSEFLVKEQLPWAGKHNVINAALTHHLNEFRWLGCADMLMDYVDFFINGDGAYDASGSAFAYHTPALTAIYDFCTVSGNEDYLIKNVERLEKYFLTFHEKHKTKSGLYWSTDGWEGTEFTISGTTRELKSLSGIRPLFNACMYSDALTLAKILDRVGNAEGAAIYRNMAARQKAEYDRRAWDGGFYKAIHPLDENLNGDIDYRSIPEDMNARELMGYIPWTFGLATEGKEAAFSLMWDERAFCGRTGLTTAEISHERFGYYPEYPCAWNGNVWPYATSYAIGAVISLLDNYDQSLIGEKELYDLIKKYAEMHYSYENGERINFIDEVMLPDEPIWYARELGKRGRNLTGGNNRGRDYNHSTFIDLVLRGLVGVKVDADKLVIEPKVGGVWKWFALENFSYRKTKYNIYYDEDGTVFGKGCGLMIEKVK